MTQNLPVEDTQPTSTTESAELTEDQAPPRRRRGCASWILWVFLSIVILLVIATLSGYSGSQDALAQRQKKLGTVQAENVKTQYYLGMQDVDAGHFLLAGTRMAFFVGMPGAGRVMDEQVQIEMQVQYELAVKDLEAKRYEAARARLEWILEWDADYPGVMEKLSDVLYYSGITATATARPTVTLTPTPDLRGVDEMFTGAQQALASGQWTLAIDTLLNLRKQKPEYNAVQVDGMLFVAYRNRGVDKIKGNAQSDPAITGSDLEGGTYDLAVAERFGVLDNEAQAWRRRADWYVSGASFWEVNWANAIDYFEPLVIEAPYLFDGAGWSAKARYKYALIKYGDWWAAQGNWCNAQEQYQKALSITDIVVSITNAEVEPTATYVAQQCSSPSGEETPIPENEVTPVPLVTDTPPPPDASQPTETQPATPYP